MDLDDRVAGVVLPPEQVVQLGLGEVLLERSDPCRQLGQRLRVALLGQLEEDLGLVDALALLAEALDRAQDDGRLARDGLRLLGVLPEIRRRGALAQLRRTTLERGEVKGASRARRPSRPGRARDREASRAASRPPLPGPQPWRRTP
jgi:hypothetical protein